MEGYILDSMGLIGAVPVADFTDILCLLLVSVGGGQGQGGGSPGIQSISLLVYWFDCVNN